MKPLPTGITGFSSSKVPQEPAIAYPEFKQHLYTAAQLSQCTVRSCHNVLLVENYYRAILEDRSGKFQLLCNFVSAYIAFCQVDERESPGEKLSLSGMPQTLRASFSYLEKPALANALQTLFHYNVLLPDDLNQFPEEHLLTQLSAFEINQIGHWQPQTIGEVVFNHWD